MTADTYFDLLRATVFAVTCWVLPAWASYRLIKRPGESMPLSQQLAAAGALYLAFVVLISEGLGMMGWLFPFPAAICSTLYWLLCVKFRPKQQSRDLQAALRWTQTRCAEGYWIAAPFIAIFIIQAAARGFSYPPLSWDSLTYHAFLPARWVQLGTLTPFAAPGGMDSYRAYPINHELLVAWIMFPFHSDLFANFVNTIPLLLGAASIYGLCRELNVPPRIAAGAPLLLTFAPPLWGLATTQYADIYGNSTILCGLLFLMRYARTRALLDLVISAVGVGLAAGARYNALPLCVAFVFAIVLIAIIQRWNRATTMAHLLLAVFVGLACGSYQYARNWIELGNPVYPMEIALGGHVIFEASQAGARALSELQPIDRMTDLYHFFRVFSASPYAWGAPLAVVLCLAGGAIATCRRGSVALWLCASILLFTFASFYLPSGGHMAHVRTFWPGNSHRFLSVPMCMGIVLAASFCDRFALASRLWVLLVVLSLTWFHWTNDYTAALSLRSQIVIVALALLGAAFIAVVRNLETLQLRPMRRAIAISVLVLCSPIIIYSLERHRMLDRHRLYAHGCDYHDVLRDEATVWKYLDKTQSRLTIAIAKRRESAPGSSYLHSSTAWYFYPLMGSHLQHEVVYASLYEAADVPSVQYRGAFSQDWTDSIWLSNLDRLDVDLLLMEKDAIPEAEWVKKHASLFEPTLETDNHSLFALRRDQLPIAITSARRDEIEFRANEASCLASSAEARIGCDPENATNGAP